MNRMRLWRAKKMFGEAGRLIQICVWAPEREVDLVRDLCTRVSEPNERGQSLRSVLFQQLRRRRTLFSHWSGIFWKAEFDAPFIGPWWFMRHIGGRVLGPDETHIELTPEEAEALKDRLRRAADQELHAWAKEHKLVGQVRDHTGVVISPHKEENATRHERSPGRPVTDAEFAANESGIARSILQAAEANRKPPFQNPSIFEYEGFSNFPSFCQIAHRKLGDRVQFALIHMPHGGTSPTNMVESLATYLRQRFYPKVDAGLIDWFDVVPPNTYSSVDKLSISAVSLQHANGVYSDPSWSKGDALPEDWIAFITDTIARGQKARSLAEAASLHPVNY
ncbi:MAG: hypothetical protein M3Y72_21545 [Acidobacteriota bacterium]|nr:hypothetical protein [Acidobacteriota bacterium]